MSYTNDLKDQHLDQFFEWVGDNKFDEINFESCGTFDDCYEEDVQSYIEENADELWKEYFESLPERDDYCEHCGHTPATGACFHCKMD